MNRLYKEYSDRAEFLLVYIREAHPDDGWQVPPNRRQGVIVNQPKTSSERAKVATQACSALRLELPTVVDSMDNKVGEAYQGWPDRLYVVGKSGTIDYAGDKGPWGFDVGELESFLEIYLNT